MSNDLCNLDDEESGCYSQCRASRGDGECSWEKCPQALDWKPICPLDNLCAVHDKVAS